MTEEDKELLRRHEQPTNIWHLIIYTTVVVILICAAIAELSSK